MILFAILNIIIEVFLFCFAVLGFECRAFTLSPIFVRGFSRYTLPELFAQAGFEPRSS
jgi:hypothetical protein